MPDIWHPFWWTLRTCTCGKHHMIKSYSHMLRSSHAHFTHSTTLPSKHACTHTLLPPAAKKQMVDAAYNPLPKSTRNTWASDVQYLRDHMAQEAWQNPRDKKQCKRG